MLQLVEEGNTILLVELHLNVIKCADWVSDLGPGGHIVAEGPAEEIANTPNSLTGQYLNSFVPAQSLLATI